MQLTTAFLLLRNTAYVANAGIPLFSQSVFYQILLLVPIVVIEAYVHRKYLKISVAKAVWLTLGVNLLSTVVGGLLILLPLGALLGAVLLGSSVPVPPGAFPLLPLEIMVTLIPMFGFSVVIERWVAGFRLKHLAPRQLWRSFLLANGMTYILLEVLAVTQLVKGYWQGRGLL